MTTNQEYEMCPATDGPYFNKLLSESYQGELEGTSLKFFLEQGFWRLAETNTCGEVVRVSDSLWEGTEVERFGGLVRFK